MIIRILVIDPAPKSADCDVIVYQVPERSRAHQLLVEMLDDAGHEWTSIESNPRKKKRKKRSKKR